MDCRNPLWLGLWVLSGAVGCTSWGGVKQADHVVTRPSESSPKGTVVKKEKEPDQPARTPKASTCVALADWYAKEAQAPGREQAQIDQLRDVARKQYQQALIIDPKHLPAYQALGRLYLVMGDHAHAMATFRKGIDVGPKNASMWYDLGMCQLREKDWDQALQCLNRAVELDPENREYINMLGHTLSRTGRYQESLAVFSGVYGEAKAYYNVARMLRYLNNPDLSKQYVQAALKKDPNLEPAHKLLAQLEGRPDSSLQQVSRSESDKPTTSEAPSPRPDNQAPATDMAHPPALSTVTAPSSGLPLPTANATPPSGPILPPDPLVPTASIIPPEAVVPPAPPPISFRQGEAK